MHPFHNVYLLVLKEIDHLFTQVFLLQPVLFFLIKTFLSPTTPVHPHVVQCSVKLCRENPHTLAIYDALKS